VSSDGVIGRHLPRRLTRVVQSALNRVEASSLPRLQRGEIYGAVTVGGLIILLLLVRWLIG
jgi:hypothetical protein